MKKISKKKLLIIVIVTLIILDIFVPIKIETTTICTYSRRNLITGPLTEQDRGLPEGKIVDGGVCSPSKYGIYFL